MPIARSVEQISPELALVDHELDSTARRALPDASDCLAPPVDPYPVAPGPRRRGFPALRLGAIPLALVAAAIGLLAVGHDSDRQVAGTSVRADGTRAKISAPDAAAPARAPAGSATAAVGSRRPRSAVERRGSSALARGSRRRVLQRHPLARELARPRPLAPPGRRRCPARIAGSRGVPLVRLPGARDGNEQTVRSARRARSRQGLGAPAAAWPHSARPTGHHARSDGEGTMIPGLGGSGLIDVTARTVR